MKRAYPLVLPLAALAMLAACGKSPDTLYAEARKSFAAQDYQAARISLAAALREQPRNRDMLRLLLDTQVRLGDPDGAQSALDRYAAAGASAVERRRAKAAIALLRSRPEDALALIGSDRGAEGWQIRAQALLAIGGRDAEAVRAFEQGLATAPSQPLATAYLRYRLETGDLQGARSAYLRLRGLAPQGYQTLVASGDLAKAEGNLDAAAAAYGKAIAAHPDEYAPVLALADVYDRQGRVDKALEQVEAAAKLAGDDPAVEDMRIQLLSEKGEWEKIRLALQSEETTLDPSSGRGMSYAEALLRLGQAEHARVLFKRAALLLPGNPYSRMMLGEAQLATGDAQSAWQTLRPLAATVLARQEVLEVAERAARAVQAPEAAALRARLQPQAIKATMAMIGAGDAAIARQDWAETIAVYENLNKRGADPEVLKRLALASSRLGRADQAIGYADKALALSPDAPDYLYMAGLTRLDAKRDLAHARGLLEAAQRSDPRNAQIAQALERAKSTMG